MRKRAGDGERRGGGIFPPPPPPLPSRARLILALLVYTSPLYYLRAWHRLQYVLRDECRNKVK